LRPENILLRKDISTMTEYIEKQWREITSRNPVSGTSFAQGLKDFKFSVGQGYGFIPSQSYFRVEIKVTASDLAPDIASTTVFADGCIGNMFNDIYFNIGGQTVSSITTGLPQCDILKNRLTKSSAYNDTIGVTQEFQASFAKRTTNLASNSTDMDAVNSKGRNQRMFIWQPAIGIFDVSQPLGAGEYDIQLNPSQDYIKAAIDTYNVDVDGKAVGIAVGNVNLLIVDMRFYACLVRVNLPASGVETLHLMEMSVHSANAPKGTIDINEEVSVPSSTRAITLFLQDQLAGKTTSVPPSKFHLAGYNIEAIGLENYQIQYGNITKPTVRYESNYTPDILSMQQRYINSALESGQYFNPSGFESLDEYMERGPFFHESFVKSADNLATRAQITAKYKKMSRDARLFIVAHNSRTVQVTRQNGLVTDIKSLNV
jgi:hypothetical protein